MQSHDKIALTGEKETLFITLYAKALDNRSAHSILHDKTADELIKRIDYDFTKFDDPGNHVIVVRAKQFDEWIKEFIVENKTVIVVYLGCGLDTRITRISPPSQVSWYDLDYPDVIKFRKTFYQEKDGYRMIESSVNDPGWLKQIPADRPTLIIAEGLLEYLDRDEVKKLLNDLTGYFPHGQIIFDVMNSFAIKSGKKKLKATTGAVHKWAVDNVNEVDQLNPALKRITSLPLFDSIYMKKLSTGSRLFLKMLSLIPNFRNMIRLMRYQF